MATRKRKERPATAAVSSEPPTLGVIMRETKQRDREQTELEQLQHGLKKAKAVQRELGGIITAAASTDDMPRAVRYLDEAKAIASDLEEQLAEIRRNA